MIQKQLLKLLLQRTASKIDGYSYFGDVNCKVFKLEDWIERATKDQRGKNGHLYLCICYCGYYSIPLIMI